MISGLTCKFLGALFSLGAKVWLFQRAQGIFQYLHPPAQSCSVPLAVAIGTQMGFSV